MSTARDPPASPAGLQLGLQIIHRPLKALVRPLACPRAGWVRALLLEWLRKQRNHPAQGLALVGELGLLVIRQRLLHPGQVDRSRRRLESLGRLPGGSACCC